MTAPQFLSSLETRGVVFIPDPAAPSGFRVKAPRGVVTPKVAEKIRAALPSLTPLIAESGKRTAPSCAHARAREALPQETGSPAVVEPTRKGAIEGPETVDRFSPESQWLDELADRMIEGRHRAETLGVASLKVGALEIAEPARWLSLAAGRLGRFVERCRELQGRGEDGREDLARVEHELIAESVHVESVLSAVCQGSVNEEGFRC